MNNHEGYDRARYMREAADGVPGEATFARPGGAGGMKANGNAQDQVRAEGGDRREGASAGGERLRGERSVNPQGGNGAATGEATPERTHVKRPLSYYARRQWLASYLRWKRQLIREELLMWSRSMLMSVPGRLGSGLRVRCLPFRRVGKNVLIWQNAVIRCPERIELQSNIRINTMVYIDASGGVEIGSYVGIGPGAQIYTVNHEYKDPGRRYWEQEYDFARVVIEDDVFVGGGSIILPGVTVRRGTIVAAGAVVTRDTEPYSLIGGVPARVIGRRDST